MLRELLPSSKVSVRFVWGYLIFLFQRKSYDCMRKVTFTSQSHYDTVKNEVEVQKKQNHSHRLIATRDVWKKPAFHSKGNQPYWEKKGKNVAMRTKHHLIRRHRRNHKVPDLEEGQQVQKNLDNGQDIHRAKQSWSMFQVKNNGMPQWGDHQTDKWKGKQERKNVQVEKSSEVQDNRNGRVEKGIHRQKTTPRTCLLSLGMKSSPAFELGEKQMEDVQNWVWIKIRNGKLGGEH